MAALTEQVWRSVRQLSLACQDQIQLGEEAAPMLTAGIRLQHYVLDLDLAAAPSADANSLSLSGALTQMERLLQRTAPAVQVQDLSFSFSASSQPLRYVRVSVATSFSDSLNPGTGTGTSAAAGRSGCSSCCRDVAVLLSSPLRYRKHEFGADALRNEQRVLGEQRVRPILQPVAALFAAAVGSPAQQPAHILLDHPAHLRPSLLPGDISRALLHSA